MRTLITAATPLGLLVGALLTGSAVLGIWWVTGSVRGAQSLTLSCPVNSAVWKFLDTQLLVHIEKLENTWTDRPMKLPDVGFADVAQDGRIINVATVNGGGAVWINVDPDYINVRWMVPEATGELAYANIARRTGYIEAFTNERRKVSGTCTVGSSAKF